MPISATAVTAMAAPEIVSAVRPIGDSAGKAVTVRREPSVNETTEPKQSRAPRPSDMPPPLKSSAIMPPTSDSNRPTISPAFSLRPSSATSSAMPTTGSVAEITAAVTAPPRAWPWIRNQAPRPIRLPTAMPFSQLTLSSAPGPSITAHMGSSASAASPIRSAVSCSGGSSGMMKSAAGRPAAQISMEAMQTRFAAKRLCDGAKGSDAVVMRQN